MAQEYIVNKLTQVSIPVTPVTPHETIKQLGSQILNIGQYVYVVKKTHKNSISIL